MVTSSAALRETPRVSSPLSGRTWSEASCGRPSSKPRGNACSGRRRRISILGPMTTPSLAPSRTTASGRSSVCRSARACRLLPTASSGDAAGGSSLILGWEAFAADRHRTHGTLDVAQRGSGADPAVLATCGLTGPDPVGGPSADCPRLRVSCAPTHEAVPEGHACRRPYCVHMLRLWRARRPGRPRTRIATLFWARPRCRPIEQRGRRPRRRRRRATSSSTTPASHSCATRPTAPPSSGGERSRMTCCGSMRDE